MQVVVLGATGNVGTAVMRALGRDADVTSIVGVARRTPTRAQVWPGAEKATWRSADIAQDPLDFVAGADAVIHLAWMIQPSRDEPAMWATNVTGSRRVLDALREHDVLRLVYASSVGTYASSAKHPRRSEDWPATGIPTSTYSRHKAEVEHMLDEVEATDQRLGIVRLRTSLVFQRSAASEIHRLFLGRLAPWHLPRPLRIIPRSAKLTFQATHADDIADAYVRAVHSDAIGAFNVAAEPVLTAASIAGMVDGRNVPIPDRLVRAAAAVTYATRLQPTEPGWFDMATRSPIMDTTRVREELGWSERISAESALREVLEGIGDGAGGPTAALAPRR